MRFQYDEQKDQNNLARHDVDFETAALVFDDPYAVTIRDTAHDEEEDRYITIGEIGPGAILFVVYTWFADKKGEPRRSISECIALLAEDSTATIDADFARDVAAAVESHREPLEPPAWD